MKKSGKRLLIISIVVIALLIAAMAISSRQESWGQISFKSSDITLEMQLYANQFNSSRYHIWYNSFNNFGLLLFLLVPIALSEIYAKGYYGKTDRNIIYRLGFRKYYMRKSGKALAISAVLIIIPLLVEWLLLSILPTTRYIYIEGAMKPKYAVISPVTILDPWMKAMAISNPEHCVWIEIALYAVYGTIYGLYAYAIGNFMRSRILRYLAPVLSLVIADFVIGRLIPNFPNSILFDTYNPAMPVGLSYLIPFYTGLLIVSIILLVAHYARRSKEG